MALKVQSSFSAGELDPALHERTNFDKYQSGLKTGRGPIVGKTGRLISRMGRANFVTAKLQNRKVKYYSPPNSGYVIEFGHQYTRVYDFNALDIGGDAGHALTEADLPNVHFVTCGSFVFIFCDGKTTLLLDYLNVAFVTTIFDAFPSSTIYVSNSAGGTGYDVDYYATMICNGQECLGTITATGKLPIAVTETNDIVFKTPSGVYDVTEMRVYRRPRSGGAFGYIGSSTSQSTGGGFTSFTFSDKGQVADYTHLPPAADTSGSSINQLSKTGAIYQQRLLITEGSIAFANPEAIHASRPGVNPNSLKSLPNFYRDYPINAASALTFKAGTSGRAKVLRMVDNDGLVVFTTIGVFLNNGELSPTNLGLSRKGNWVVDETVTPLCVPGGVIFVDISTNTIRQLSWSTEAASYSGDELTSFSSHLFIGKRILSMAFHQGEVPCLFTVFDDGTFASFTYEPLQQMRAWTRHDSSDVVVEDVVETGYPNKTFFVVEKNGYRYLELTVPRYISGATLESDPEAYMGHSIAAMDGMLSFRTLLNDSLVGTDVFTIAPVVADDWTGVLRITTGASNVFPSPGVGDVGSIYRFFDSDGSAIDLEVVGNVGPRDITVQPDSEFPSSYATTARLYKTASSMSGLSHLEGEYPAVMVDGGVLCSPNNDIEKYESLQVVGGVLTLPDGVRGAIVHVGRPITSDIETLDIDTVEQRPVLLESKTVNKVYIKTYNSRGLYVGNKFPADNKVDGMQDLEEFEVNYEDENPIIANTFQKPTTRRYEVSLPGDWSRQGRVCLRQVDPVHFEILSIIPDLEDERR
jgi:hypothetical protein